MIKACIFDLDGVITDSAKYHFIAWRRLANSLGFDFDEAFNEKLKGVSRIRSLEMILELGGITKTEAEKEALATLKNEWYTELLVNMTPNDALPNVKAILTELRQRGIKIGLGSASKNAVPILERLEMLNDFEVIIDGTKTTESKPHPQVFLMGAEALGVAPSETVVFEDAEKGVEAALNGGFWTVGIGNIENLGHAHRVIAGLDEVDADWILNW